MSFYVDLTLGDLGYHEARVEYRYCTEPQELGVVGVKVFVMINGQEIEVYDQLRNQAKEYVDDQCRQDHGERSLEAGA
jgi:hypothetical protein